MYLKFLKECELYISGMWFLCSMLLCFFKLLKFIFFIRFVIYFLLIIKLYKVIFV